MTEPEYLHTEGIIDGGWVRLPGSPVEVRFQSSYNYPHFDIRWNPELADGFNYFDIPWKG